MNETDHDATFELPKDVIEALPAMSPPTSFATRTLAARRKLANPEPTRRRWLRPTVSVAGVLAALALVLVLWRSVQPSASTNNSGHQVATTRTTLALGSQALAVLEPAADVQWSVVQDKTDVLQTAGSVFYRVDKTTTKTFVVTTPAGVIEVTGTCFQVEVPMQIKKHVIGAAVGAALVVAVYEGSVFFSDDGGANASVPVEAGRELVVSADGRASVRNRTSNQANTAEPNTGEASPTLDAPPPDDADRGQLLARDSAQRAEIVSLRKKVSQLDKAVAASTSSRRNDSDEDTPWYKPSQEMLVRFAKDCRVRYDTPSIMGPTPAQMDSKMAGELGLSEVEREGVNQLFRSMHAEFREFVRGLYIEVTGDSAAADKLSVKAMVSDLLDKSPKGEADRVQQRIANERAGLAQPPSDLSATTAVERYYRQLAALGDDTEKRLADVLGPERTRRLREENGGFGSQHEIAGCPGEPIETHEE